MFESAREWTLFLAKRFSVLLLSLVLVSMITFAVTHFIGNPVYLLVGPRHTQQMLDNMTRELGLDKPLWEQYANYIGQLLHGDLGTSRYSYNPVTQDIRSRLPATLELSTFALILGVLWAVPAGIIAGARRNSPFARAIDVIAKASVSMPSFWLGLLLIYVLFAQLHWLPAPLGRIDREFRGFEQVTGWYTIDTLLAGDWDAFVSSVKHLILPALTLAVTTSPSTLQIARNKTEEIMQSDFIRTARAFGLPPSTVRRYALKNMLAPVITMIAMTYGYLLSGTVLVEVVFTWPGLGLYAVDAMNHSDYEPVMGVVLISAGFYLFVYLLADVFNALVDPRVRVTK
ncbi:ABC transporter permease [Aggregatilinea lenta]|uniref:ABC transporter permease n=1 Tax=Aggregatilinea lenta TaxID=913108 RepID=UPI000E5BE0B9|nr:ABC transporter permease [Aggregatilinea lenta]